MNGAEQMAAAAEKVDALIAKGEYTPPINDRTAILEEPPAEDAPEETAEAAEPEKPAAKPEAKADAADDKPDEKPEPDGKVVPQERVGFRKEKRKWREKRDAEKAELDAREKAITELEERVQPLVGAREAFENGDIDMALRAAFGIGAGDFNQKFVDYISNRDPRVDRLEKLEREQRERDKKAADERRATERKAAEAEAEREWREELVEEMKDSGNPLLVSAADDPGFQATVLQIQKENWDGESTLSNEEAAAQALDTMKQLRDRLIKLIPVDGPESSGNGAGDQAAEEPEGANAATRTAKKSAKHVSTSRRGAVEASPSRPRTEKEWNKHWASKMANSTPD